MLVVMLVGVVAMSALGARRALAGAADGMWLMFAGAMCMAMGVFLFLIVLIVHKTEANTHRVHDVMIDLYQTAEWIKAPVRSIAEDIKISDAARSLAHREKEIAALRSAIRDELSKGNWELAASLVRQIEERFGYKDEAERLREDIVETRKFVIETKIEEALAQIDLSMEGSDWPTAIRESERLMNLFPNDDRVRNLPAIIEQRREKHKRDLLREWDSVVQRREVDRAVEMLQKLDQYLTPEEAGVVQASAREILKDQLLNLGMQFKLAVADRRWRDALEVGVEIIEERPNSKMAEEVRQMIPKLRERAGMTAEAVVIDQRPGHI
jgi:hypothetical protein